MNYVTTTTTNTFIFGLNTTANTTTEYSFRTLEQTTTIVVGFGDLKFGVKF